MDKEIPIVEYPESVLTEVSPPVERFDESLAELIDDLFATLDQTSGIGLSAPQIGRLERVSIVRVPDDEYGPMAYVNPRILAKSAPGIVEESCLSVPGVVGNVIRFTRVRVAAQDVQGQAFEKDVTGMHAACLQHEIDHLDGKLIIDRFWWFRRLQARYQLRKGQRLAADIQSARSA